MQFNAKARYVRFSPYKLRPLADVVRGKDVSYALNWLATHAVKRIVPVQKAIESAVANAKQQGNLDKTALYVDEIRIDEGPSYKYFKPGAMGRSNPQKRRFSHISVILKSLSKNKD